MPAILLSVLLPILMRTGQRSLIWQKDASSRIGLLMSVTVHLPTFGAPANVSDREITGRSSRGDSRIWRDVLDLPQHPQSSNTLKLQRRPMIPAQASHMSWADSRPSQVSRKICRACYQNCFPWTNIPCSTPRGICRSHRLAHWLTPHTLQQHHISRLRTISPRTTRLNRITSMSISIRPITATPCLRNCRRCYHPLMPRSKNPCLERRT